MVLFTARDYVEEREVNIKKIICNDFDDVKYLKDQQNFSKWATLDPNQKTLYSGTDGTIGFIFSWKGNDEMGEGVQEIIGIIDREWIDYELQFIKPFESRSVAFITTTSINDNATLVKWNFVGKMNNPMQALLLIMNMGKW